MRNRITTKEYETNAYRLGRLMIHWAGTLITMAIIYRVIVYVA